MRSVSATPVPVRLVRVELRAHQRVSVASTLGSNDTYRDYCIYLNPHAYAPPAGDFAASVLGIDVPLLIPIPRDAFPSGVFPGFHAVSSHSLAVTVFYGSTAEAEQQHLQLFPYALKFYDTLPLYRQFNEPVVSTSLLPDLLVVIDTKLPVLLVGPQDELVVEARISANPAKHRHRHLKLVKLTLQLQEIFESHEGGGLAYKESKLLSTHRAFEEHVGNRGIDHTFRVKFPLHNYHLHMLYPKVDRKHTDDVDAVNETDQIQNINLARLERLPKLPAGIPLTNSQGFSTTGKLFLIRYEAVVKAKLGHAKDTEVRLPVTVCPFDRNSSSYVLQWIMQQCEWARDRFGRDVVARATAAKTDPELQQLFANFAEPPTVYSLSKQDWTRLGYDPHAWGEKPPTLFFSHFID